MECPRCHAQIPETAHFCPVCGDDRRGHDAGRRRSFAARPDEPVASFALVSSIMPRGSGQRPQTYRVALTIALVVALVAAIFGAMPIAVLVAAFAVPIVYVVYMYDVNLWEDEPLPVTGLAFGLTGVLAILWTVLWTWLRGPVSFATPSFEGSGSGAPSLGTFLLVALLAPVVGEVIRQVGPVLLASRPQFDDLMDGLTFGVISGVAYSTFDTLVRHWALLTGGVQQSDPGLWVSLVFLEGFVKPLLMGTATGLACAEFSGLGRGFDGFTPRYLRAVILAVVANVAYSAGVYLFSFLGNATVGVLLSIVWGLLILAILILRLRVVLHTGLMEAALEHAARTAGAGPDGELEFCSQCEMPLQPGAAFCAACGTAVNATANGVRVRPKQPAKVGGGTSAPAEETVTVRRGSSVAGENGPTSATDDTTTIRETGRTGHDGEEQA
ncbi:zinc-ribbon domain-containing protein [Microlunatus flavus]|uniref:Membrane proteinase PrsW, cleaves anti-sigma factor RsiW, M82 family n=1 Tax=Microlunatus flavus TaxID=1036181 RepID=A0A1H9HAF5_9ACTN|nr:zinc-ribbon domain-containing protein [Microlunatus flavus]SEQ59314.1 Membrane proteinase PrsW, cleaves anti-sigma factor RsiW, M82 family [Microlunatus flavus]